MITSSFSTASILSSHDRMEKAGGLVLALANQEICARLPLKISAFSLVKTDTTARPHFETGVCFALFFFLNVTILMLPLATSKLVLQSLFRLLKTSGMRRLTRTFSPELN